LTKSLLITGGCGFIGSNLIAQLRETGDYNIRVLDDESEGKREWISDFDVDFVCGSICDPKTVANSLDGIDSVVHLAAHTSVIDSVEQPKLDFDINVVGTLNVLEAMKDKGINSFINASTGGAIIGDTTPPVHEDMLPKPVSPYGASKLAVEGYCSAYAQSYGLAATSLRFSNVYGPRSFHKGSVVAHFFKCILNNKELTVYGNGSQTRDYVYSQDLATGILNAIEAAKPGVFQLGTGLPTTLNELIDVMREVVGDDYKVDVSYLDFRAGEILHNYCQIDRAKREIGYSTQTSLKDGLSETWKWFLENRAIFEA
jgi:UDP-glucose 4-epimerase